MLEKYVDIEELRDALRVSLEHGGIQNGIFYVYFNPVEEKIFWFWQDSVNWGWNPNDRDRYNYYHLYDNFGDEPETFNKQIEDEIGGQGFETVCEQAGIPIPSEELTTKEQIEYIKENAPEYAEATVEACYEALINNILEEIEERVYEIESEFLSDE
jgi:hypothetical protein